MKDIKGMQVVILREIRDAADRKTTITDTELVIRYDYSISQTKKILKDLCCKGYLVKVKDGWFVKSYDITENGRRQLAR
jgi:predicted transcriptional regulator